MRAWLLGSEIQSVAGECDRVGKDIMCAFVPGECRESDDLKMQLMQTPVASAEPQTLEPIEDVSVHDRIALLPPHDEPQFVYIDGKNKVFPFPSPIHLVFGNVQWPVHIEGLRVTVPPFVPTENPQPAPPFSIEGNWMKKQKWPFALPQLRVSP